MIKAAQFENFFDFFHEFRSQVAAGKRFDIMGTPSWYWPRSVFLPWPRCDLKEVDQVDYIPPYEIPDKGTIYGFWSSMGVVTLMADWQYLCIRDGADNYFTDMEEYPLKMFGRYGNANLPHLLPPDVVPVSGITLTPATMNFTVGYPDEFKTCSIKFSPAGATDKTYTLERSDAGDERFTLIDDGKGKLTVSKVLRAGNYTVKVVSNANPNITKTLTIKAEDAIPLQQIMPDKAMVQIVAGDTNPHVVTLKFTPENASDKRYTVTPKQPIEGKLTLDDNGAGQLTFTATVHEQGALYQFDVASVETPDIKTTFGVGVGGTSTQ